MKGEIGLGHQCNGNVYLETEPSRSTPFFLIARRKQDTQPGSGNRPRLGIARQLIPVIQGHVAQPGAEPFDVLDRNGIAELMADTAERPFLGEVVGPVATIPALEGADVLHHPGFLVVGLLEEEAVVLDLSDKGGCRETTKSVNGKQ
jgi:hypothetical protein